MRIDSTRNRGVYDVAFFSITNRVIVSQVYLLTQFEPNHNLHREQFNIKLQINIYL